MGSSAPIYIYIFTHTHVLTGYTEAASVMEKHFRTAQTMQELQHVHGSIISGQPGTIFGILSWFLSTLEIKCCTVLP